MASLVSHSSQSVTCFLSHWLILSGQFTGHLDESLQVTENNLVSYLLDGESAESLDAA